MENNKSLIKLFNEYFNKRNIAVNIKENDFNFVFHFDLKDISSLNRILSILDTLMKVHSDILIQYECNIDFWYPDLYVTFDLEDEDENEEDFDEDEDEDADQIGYSNNGSKFDLSNVKPDNKYKGYITFKLVDGIGLIGYEEDIFEEGDDDQYWTKQLVNLETYLKDNKIKDVVKTDRFSKHFGI